MTSTNKTICVIKYGVPFLSGCNDAWLWCVGKRLLSCGWLGRFPVVKMPCTNRCWYLCNACDEEIDDDDPDDPRPPVGPPKLPEVSHPEIDPVIAA
jgi:hypothetical protein